MRRAACVAMLLCGLLLPACDRERRQALDALTSPQAGMRVAGLRKLAKTGDASLVAQIAPLTRDPLARVRRAAVAALGATGVGNRLGAVMARLEDPDVEVRLVAVRVLGDSGRAAAKRMLLEILDDPNMVVRKAAERALRAMGLSRKEQRQARAKKRLAADIVRLAASDEQVRATAVRDLGASGRREAEGPLVARVGDRSALVLGELALALANLGTSGAREALGKMARSPEAASRIAATRGLAQKRAFEELTPLLRDADGFVRRAAFEGAAEHGAGATPAILIEACGVLTKLGEEEGDGAIRIAAARILGARSKSCGPALEKVLKSWRSASGQGKGEGPAGTLVLWRCRLAAALGRGELQVLLTRQLYARHRREARRWVDGAQWQALDERPGETRDKKPVAKKPMGPHQRRKALEWLLGRYKGAGARPEQKDALLPPRVAGEVVVAAINALPARVDALALVAEIAAEAPRTLRVEALSRLQEMEAATGAEQRVRADRAAETPAGRAIWAGLRAEEASIRRASMRACQHLGKSALPQALEWLRSKRFEEREAAAICAGRLKAGRAVPVLMEVLAEDAQLAVVRALAQIGDKRAAYAIARLLNEDHPASRQGERVAIIEALQALAEPSTGKFLLRELSHPIWEVRRAAAGALGKLRFAGASAELQVCAEDYIAAVRESCLGAMKK